MFIAIKYYGSSSFVLIPDHLSSVLILCFGFFPLFWHTGVFNN